MLNVAVNGDPHTAQTTDVLVRIAIFTLWLWATQNKLVRTRRTSSVGWVIAPHQSSPTHVLGWMAAA